MLRFEEAVEKLYTGEYKYMTRKAWLQSKTKKEYKLSLTSNRRSLKDNNGLKRFYYINSIRSKDWVMLERLR